MSFNKSLSCIDFDFNKLNTANTSASFKFYDSHCFKDPANLSETCIGRSIQNLQQFQSKQLKKSSSMNGFLKKNQKIKGKLEDPKINKINNLRYTADKFNQTNDNFSSSIISLSKNRSCSNLDEKKVDEKNAKNAYYEYHKIFQNLFKPKRENKVDNTLNIYGVNDSEHFVHKMKEKKKEYEKKGRYFKMKTNKPNPQLMRLLKNIKNKLNV
ncbi:MAG: hypothetical protein MJ252_06845, partial [archaeon]|nr:hypothetical protein [archaeon]